MKLRNIVKACVTVFFGGGLAVIFLWGMPRGGVDL